MDNQSKPNPKLSSAVPSASAQPISPVVIKPTQAPNDKRNAVHQPETAGESPYTTLKLYSSSPDDPTGALSTTFAWGKALLICLIIFVLIGSYLLVRTILITNTTLAKTTNTKSQSSQSQSNTTSNPLPTSNNPLNNNGSINSQVKYCSNIINAETVC